MSDLIYPQPPKTKTYNIISEQLRTDLIITRSCAICGTATSDQYSLVCEDCKDAMRWVKKIKKQCEGKKL